MTNKNYESISALLDDEVTSKELDETLEQIVQPEQIDTFTRYGLIGDVLRQEQELVESTDFASNIQAALNNVEQESVEQASETGDVVSIASHPSWSQRISNKVKSFASTSTGRGMSQMAIAASVALVAVVGVSNMTPQEDVDVSPTIMTSPLIGGVAPVSLSTDKPAVQKSANQMTQSRINSLISDHQQQLRVADDKAEKEKEENKVID
jgi:sigma-E factor negative regulatory protein RseA